MSILTDTISSIVDIKIKHRDDGVTDQYNRILMTKMCIILSAIIGFDYFADKVTCIVDGDHHLDEGFVGATCWIQGFYIYKEMKEKLGDSAYYGLPRNMDYDGLDSSGVLCSTVDRGLDTRPTCNQMHKLYYLQYQYLPFLIAAFAVLFYFPYIVFKVTNTDLVSLKNAMKNRDTTSDEILSGYFDHKKNTKRSMRYRVMMNILVKVFYLSANILAFLCLNGLINGDYISYGVNMMQWSKLPNTEAHDHSLRVRARAKPGNVLLPPMGYCELTEESRDMRNTRINHHKVLCEISQHVLYQYVLLLLWFLLVIGILVSLIGLLIALFGHMLTTLCFMNRRDNARDMYRRVTMREIDYLEYIRRKNMPLYHDVITALKIKRSK